MIALLLSFLLLIFGLICTFTTIPPTKKFLQSFHHKTPPQDPPKPITKSNNTKSELRDVFATFDKNNDGFITMQELKDSLKNIGISAGEKDVADMVEKVDSNGDGLIDFDEFCKLFDYYIISEENRDGALREAFDVFDENRDGLITVEELGLVLSSMGFTQGNTLEACKEMIKKVDVDGDGMVNFDEFRSMMKSGFGRLIPVS